MRSATNRYGVAPLALAATNGNAEIVDALLDAGADANTASPDGATALMTAARTGRRAAVKTLLDHGAAVNIREQWFGETALMWAAAEDHPDVVQLLIHSGAELDARSVPLEFARFRFNLATMVNTVLPRGSLTPLMLAARQGSLASARVAGRPGRRPEPDRSRRHHRDGDGHHQRALRRRGAADKSVARIRTWKMPPAWRRVYALVDMHTQPLMINRPTRKPSGSVEDLDLLKRILARGGDPNAPAETPILARYHNIGDGQLGAGATPLMRAARSRDVAAMRLLLDSGADPTRQSANGATALMFAATPARGAARCRRRKRGARGARSVSGSRRGRQRRERARPYGPASGRSGRRVRPGRQAVAVEGSQSRKIRDKQGRAPFDPLLPDCRPRRRCYFAVFN